MFRQFGPLFRVSSYDRRQSRVDLIAVAGILPCMRDAATRSALENLAQHFPGRFAVAEAVRQQHANTLSLIPNQPPDAVVWAQTADDVVRVVQWASDHGVPVIAFGAGTSLEGQVNAPHGGIALDMSRMTAIRRVSPEDLDCTVETGVTRRQLNAHLRDTGLFFSVDPGAEDATLGGMAATRASGTTTVRYGTMSENVLSLTAVMADGSIVETGNRARKSAAGYDLTRLLIGSEGTLGIITALTVRLHPVPQTIGAASVTFETLEDACRAALEATLANTGMARVELADALTIEAVNRYSGLSLATRPTLFIEWHTTTGCAPLCAASIREVCMGNGAVSFEGADDQEARNRLWRARHDAFWAIRGAWPGKTPVVTDACVPVSRLAECIALTAIDIRESGLIAPIVGHVGDGNFHTVPMIELANATDVAKVYGFLERLSDRAASMGGTCSGEHGIGQGKMAALGRQAGAAVHVMGQIKRALDPKGILNPGKMLPVRPRRSSSEQ